MGADNTTSRRNPFDDDRDLFGPPPNLDPIDPDDGAAEPPRGPFIGGSTPASQFSQKTKTVAPAYVHVCLDCETYYPDGDGWDYCPNCSARVFEVSKD